MSLLLAPPPLRLYKAHATSRDALTRTLHRLADAQGPAMLKDVAAVLVAAGVALDRSALARLLGAGQLVEAIALVEGAWDTVGLAGLQATFAPQLEALALQAAQATPIATVRIRFNVQDPEALQAIQQYAGAQIVSISATTRAAVRDIVTRAFTSGTSLTQQIDEIATLVGLTPQQAEAMSRYREGLLEAGEKPPRVHTLVTQRSAALRRQRAETIARTESIDAINRGQIERLQQSVRDGLLDATRVTRRWLLGPRACPTICQHIPGMNPDGVGLSQLFQTPKGPLLHPPAHPMCMCAVSMKVTT